MFKKYLKYLTTTIDSSYFDTKYSINNVNELYMCGDNSKNIFLSNISIIDSPVKITNKIQKISTGDDHYIFLIKNGAVWSSGNNFLGQGGVEGNEIKMKKVDFHSGDKIIDVSSRNFHSLFLDECGIVFATGFNHYGQLGIGNNSNKNKPVKVKFNKKIISIVAGNNYSLFLDNEGSVYSCGQNEYGQLGIGNNDNQNIPIKVSLKKKVRKISSGNNFSLFLCEDGSCYGCGKNKFGQLGIGSSKNYNKPKKVELNKKIIDIAGAFYLSIFLDEDGSVYSCGSKKNVVFIPRKLHINEKIVSISTGLYHAILLTDKGEVFSFGSNRFGQLAIPYSIYQSVTDKPIKIRLKFRVKSIMCGNNQSFFFKDTENVPVNGLSTFKRVIALKDKKIIDEEDTKSRIKPDFFTIKFKNSKFCKDIPLYLCIQSPFLKDIISKNIYEYEIDKKYYNSLDVIKEWFEGRKRIPRFDEISDVVHLSIIFQLPHLTYYLLTLIGTQFNDKRDIIELNFELYKTGKIDSPLFLASKIFIKENHEQIHRSLMEFYQDKLMDSFELNWELFSSLNSLNYEDIPKVIDHPYFKDIKNSVLNCTDTILSRKLKNHNCSLFTDMLTPNVIFRSVDGVSIALHKAILIKYEYFDKLLNSGFFESTQDEIFCELDYDTLFFIIKYIYTKTIETSILDYITLLKISHYAEKYLMNGLRIICDNEAMKRTKYLDFSNTLFFKNHINILTELNDLKFKYSKYFLKC